MPKKGEPRRIEYSTLLTYARRMVSEYMLQQLSEYTTVYSKRGKKKEGKTVPRSDAELALQVIRTCDPLSRKDAPRTERQARWEEERKRRREMGREEARLRAEEEQERQEGSIERLSQEDLQKLLSGELELPTYADQGA